MWLCSITTHLIPLSQGNEKWPSSSAGRALWQVCVVCVCVCVHAIPLVQRESRHCKGIECLPFGHFASGWARIWRREVEKLFCSINKNTWSIMWHSYRRQLGSFFLALVVELFVKSLFTICKKYTHIHTQKEKSRQKGVEEPFWVCACLSAVLCTQFMHT